MKTDHGLTSNNVTVIYRDESGLMWFGTDGGLNTFDGYTVNRFTPNGSRDTTSIAGKNVSSICEFVPNKVVVATTDGGISVYDKRKNTFSRRESSRGQKSAFALCHLGNYAYSVFPHYVAKGGVTTNQDIVHKIDLGRETQVNGVTAQRVKMRIMPGVVGLVSILVGTNTFCILDTKYENIVEVEVQAPRYSTFTHWTPSTCCWERKEAYTHMTSDLRATASSASCRARRCNACHATRMASIGWPIRAAR